MRRRLTIAIGWTARVGGWAFFLGLAIYVLVNHQGMGVRGQIARLELPSEREDALAVLLRRAALEGVPNLGWDSGYWSPRWTPFPTLLPEPRQLLLDAWGPGMKDVSKLFVVFDADGELAGAPVKWKHLFSRPEEAGYYVEPIVNATDPEFLIVREYRDLPVTVGVAPNTYEVYFRIYRLNREASPCVLTIVHTTTGAAGLFLQAEPDRHDRTVLQLVPYGTAVKTVGTAIATFVWDSEHQRFIEPPPDPQGRWRVVE